VLKNLPSIVYTFIVEGAINNKTLGSLADPDGGMGDAFPTGTHNAPKLAILRSKMGKKIGEGHSPLPL